MKEEKPKLVTAEVTDHVISLLMGRDGKGHDVYKSFFKGAIVDIEPVAFRNLEKKGRVKAATMKVDPEVTTAIISEGPFDATVVGRKKRKKKTGMREAAYDLGPPPKKETALPEGNAV